MNEPAWTIEASKYIGQREIKVVNHNPVIISAWKAIKRAGIKTDEVPWCAARVCAMLESVGIASSQFESAKSYLDWGSKLSGPELGCIVIFPRDGGGHVGFVVGKDTIGNLLVLGGNQCDQVNIRAFGRDRVASYRWPTAVPVQVAALPVFSADVIISLNDHPDIRRTFDGFQMETVPIKYSVGASGRYIDRSELIIYSWDRAGDPVGLF